MKHVLVDNFEEYQSYYIRLPLHAKAKIVNLCDGDDPMWSKDDASDWYTANVMDSETLHIIKQTACEILNEYPVKEQEKLSP